MKPKTLILMVVAVTCGLGASYMTSRLLADRQTDNTEKVAVLVARRQLDNGSAIKVPQETFEEKLYTKGEEPRDAVSKYEDLKGRILKRTLRQGDFIRADDMLDSKDPQSVFAANLPEGYRGVGLRVNLESIAGGFASLPHSRVDIIQTVRRGDDKSSYASILLENVLVLAADARTQRDEAGNAMPASIVTFALSPEDVLKLNLSREVGTLSLALRKFNDNKKSPIDRITAEDIRKGVSGHKSDGSDGDLVPAEPSTAASQPLSGLPMFPLKTEDAKPAEVVKVDAPPAAPSNIQHTLVIFEGDKARPINYLLDPVTRRVVNQEVTRTEVIARPPQPEPQKTDE
ncbi:MAG: Flp pilus assembly protein CpaB [Planctomycetota bacterium]